MAGRTNSYSRYFRRDIPRALEWLLQPRASGGRPNTDSQRYLKDKLNSMYTCKDILEDCDYLTKDCSLLLDLNINQIDQISRGCCNSLKRGVDECGLLIDEDNNNTEAFRTRRRHRFRPKPKIGDYNLIILLFLPFIPFILYKLFKNLKLYIYK